MITAHVKLFATLRGHYPHLGLGEAMEVKLPEGATAGDMVERLRLPENQVKVIFVNGIVRGKDHTLADGDEVGVFPPVGGG
jgi:molybdopterin synthase sulfur carrier subunit